MHDSSIILKLYQRPTDNLSLTILKVNVTYYLRQLNKVKYKTTIHNYNHSEKSSEKGNCWQGIVFQQCRVAIV